MILTPNTTSKSLFILVHVCVSSKCGTLSRDCVSLHTVQSAWFHCHWMLMGYTYRKHSILLFCPCLRKNTGLSVSRPSKPYQRNSIATQMVPQGHFTDSLSISLLHTPCCSSCPGVQIIVRILSSSRFHGTGGVSEPRMIKHETDVRTSYMFLWVCVSIAKGTYLHTDTLTLVWPVFHSLSIPVIHSMRLW